MKTKRTTPAKLDAYLEGIRDSVLTEMREGLKEKSFKSLLMIAQNLRIPEAFRYDRDGLIEVIMAAKIQPEPVDPAFAASYAHPFNQDLTNSLIDELEDFYDTACERFPLIYNANSVMAYKRPRTNQEASKGYAIDMCGEHVRNLHFKNILPVMIRMGNIYAQTNYFHFAALRTIMNLDTKYWISGEILRRALLKIGGPKAALRHAWTGNILFNVGSSSKKLTLGSFMLYPISHKPAFTDVAFRFADNRNIAKLDPGGLLKKIAGTRWWILPNIDEHPFMLEWLWRFAKQALDDAEFRFENEQVPGAGNKDRKRPERRDIREGGIYPRSGLKSKGPRGEETDTFN